MNIEKTLISLKNDIQNYKNSPNELMNNCINNRLNESMLIYQKQLDFITKYLNCMDPAKALRLVMRKLL